MNFMHMGIADSRHSFQDFISIIPIFSTEEDPGDVDEIEGDEPGKVFIHTEAK